MAISSAISMPALAQSISGKITDSNGKPIAGAEVHLDKDKTHVFTDANGNFTIDKASLGSVELHVSADNYSHYNKKIVITEQPITGLNIALNDTVMEIIDVHVTPLHSSRMESALPINVLAEEELRLKQASTLGETLKNEVGVHSSYYGPVSSSPIVRGLDGPRVLISQNGLDVGDASRVGGDHIVSSETSTATQIEVLRGPATLFYGSGAIGGVVNVVDNRVPTYTDTELDWQLQHNDVADEDQAAFNLNTGSGNIALHLDGFWRESNDFDIPGAAELHVEEDHDEDEHEEHEEHEEVTGKLANSAAKASGFTVGSSYLMDNGFVGFSYGRMDREYGIPGHGHAEEGEEPVPVTGELEQDRYQLLSDLNYSNSVINRVATKLAYTDYQHQEIENGAVGTTFKNESLEARFDLYHQEFDGWNGAWTIHYKASDFEAIGEEAFTPPTDSRSIAAALVEEKHFGDVLVQFGLRVEHVELEANSSFLAHEEHHEDEEHHDEDEHEEHEEMTFKKQSFTPVSASAGLVWDYQQGYNLGLSLAYSQRAPSASELFSNGPHIGTNTFEVGALYNLHVEGEDVHADLGDQDVDMETSINLDLTWRKFEGDFGFVVSAFYNQVKDYYYQQDTGFTMAVEHDHGHEEEHEEEHHDEHEEAEEHHEEGGLPVFIYRQDDVDMYGIEAEFVYQVSEPLKATIFTDYIRAKTKDNGNVPRIPPMRLGGQLNYQLDNISAELSVSRYFKQDDIAAYETETSGYTMVDANFSYYVEGFGQDLTVFVKGQNLTDEDARVHSSFLKNTAPLPGRAFTVGVRGSF